MGFKVRRLLVGRAVALGISVSTAACGSGHSAAWDKGDQMCKSGLLSAQEYSSCSAFADAYAAAYKTCEQGNVALNVNEDCSAQANAETSNGPGN